MSVACVVTLIAQCVGPALFSLCVSLYLHFFVCMLTLSSLLLSCLLLLV